MNSILEYFSFFLMSLGCVVMLFAALGLYRFPDVYMRLHSSTKVNTGGAMTILLGLILRSGISTLSAKILVLIILIFILTPVISHAIARSAHLQGKTPMVPFTSYPKEKYEQEYEYEFLKERK